MANKWCDSCIHRPKRNRLQEFSKKVIVCLTLTWFVGLLAALVVITVELITTGTSAALSDTLMYIGAPMTGGVLGYLIKSAVENREKIRGGENGASEHDESINENIDIP